MCKCNAGPQSIAGIGNLYSYNLAIGVLLAGGY